MQTDDGGPPGPADDPARVAGGAGGAVSSYSLPFLILAVVAGLMAAVMMASTTMDVAGRYFFNSPLFGAFEVTEITMGLIVFAALPLAVVRREMIVVSVISDHYPAILRRIVEGVGLLIGAGLFGFMAWRLWVYGERLWRFGEVTLELRVPKGLIVQAMSVLAAVAALACIVAIIALLRGRSGLRTIDRAA
ncbi:MAG: TRAP transporter small permease [Pseudomonadota bacterium]